MSGCCIGGARSGGSRSVLLELLDHLGIASDGVAGVTISGTGRSGEAIEVDVRYERIEVLCGTRFEVRSYAVRAIDLDLEEDVDVSASAVRDCVPESFWENRDARDAVLNNGRCEK